MDEPKFGSTDEVRRAYTGVLAARARTVHERITIGEPSVDRPSQAPGWLMGRQDTGRDAEGREAQ